MTNLEISFGWVPIQGLKDISYCFPEIATRYLREQYAKAAVYRWLVQRDDKMFVYIGETENLARRLSHYLKPGPTQTTNKRLRAFLDQQNSLSASISFELLSFEPFSINGKQYSAADLGKKEVRCFLENLLITQLPSAVEKLNHLDALEEKMIAKAAKILNPELAPNEAKALALKAIENLAESRESRIGIEAFRKLF
ncbi:MAG TPA: hypothetical protein VHZ09_14005 [Acidobacteriaceae bacterium]|jgi:hypothetical protein|nr:hypothetical protein [Acidobacteriaceae bacterium]